MTGAVEIVFTVAGPPRGKGRPRFDGRSKRTYTDAQTLSAEQRVHAAWRAAGGRTIPGPVELGVSVVLRRPQTHYRVSGELSAAGERATHPTKKPDFDNVAKLIADALNGCAFDDDAQVVEHRFIKRWANPGESEHTQVSIRPVAQPGLQAVAA